MTQANRPLQQHGFTLLEAIVALVLLSTTGMALFSWINTTLSGLNRTLEHSQKAQYRINAVALMQQINPAADPQGEITTHTFIVQWKATAIAPLKQEIDVTGMPGSYLIGLFDSNVTVLQGNTTLDQFVLRQTGYQRVK